MRPEEWCASIDAIVLTTTVNDKSWLPELQALIGEDVPAYLIHPEEARLREDGTAVVAGEYRCQRVRPAYTY